jgi:nucleotide-binding universal stress UspA family protein
METMARRSTAGLLSLRVILATDGSASAKAALTTTLAFPWPADTHVRATIASRPTWLRGRPEYVRISVERSFERLAAHVRRALARHWANAGAVVVRDHPVDAILGEAKRFSADVIVLGWRGHGAFRRLLMGSVSRSVVRRATCAILVVRRPAKEIRRVVIGVDGSPMAQRAVELAARLTPGRGAEITVVRVVEPMPMPTGGFLPASLKATVRDELAALDAAAMNRARREVERAVARLRRAEWSVRTEVRSGAPLTELLAVVARRGGDLLMVGGRATRGLERTLLGSVAEGALNRSPVPVLVAH